MLVFRNMVVETELIGGKKEKKDLNDEKSKYPDYSSSTQSYLQVWQALPFYQSDSSLSQKSTPFIHPEVIQAQKL